MKRLISRREAIKLSLGGGAAIAASAFGSHAFDLFGEPAGERGDGLLALDISTVDVALLSSGTGLTLMTSPRIPGWQDVMFDMTALRNSTGEIDSTIASRLEDAADYFRQRLADDPAYNAVMVVGVNSKLIAGATGIAHASWGFPVGRWVYISAGVQDGPARGATKRDYSPHAAFRIIQYGTTRADLDVQVAPWREGNKRGFGVYESASRTSFSSCPWSGINISALASALVAVLEASSATIVRLHAREIGAAMASYALALF